MVEEVEREQRCVTRWDAFAALSGAVRLLFFEQPPVSYKEVARHFGLAVGSLGFTRGAACSAAEGVLEAGVSRT